MSVTCCRYLLILVLSGFLAVTSQPAQADPAVPVQPSAPIVYPQIVRISYVEGDVRIARGKLADKVDTRTDGESTGWEKAEVNLSIDAGYSLVTGKGRAEIEFEDASTVYLAENSVLTFTRLTSTAGVSDTEMELLSGTATMNAHPLVQGDYFRLSTPTDNISILYPHHAVWRVDSYLDAMSITPQRDPSITDAALTEAQSKMIGKTTTYTHGARVLRPPAAADHAASAEWDAWVAKQISARTAAMSATMKDAGLNQPIPGLADMDGQGHFFACEPYGTCWEPTNGWRGKATEVSEVTTKPVGTAEAAAPSGQTAAATGAGRPPAPATKAPKQSATDIYLAAHPDAILSTEDYYFPCSTFAVQDVIATDPATGKEKIIDTYFDTAMPGPYYYSLGYPTFPRFGYGYRFGPRGYGLFMTYDAWGPYAPWDWAICHTGSWIRWHRHYVWVAGTKRHHRGPVRWVKHGREVGFVPIHPRDVAGKEPLNLKDGLFKVTGKKDLPVERLAFDTSKPYQLLTDPPKNYVKPELEPLLTAEVPSPEAHSAFEVALAGKVPLADQGKGAKGSAFAGGSAVGVAQTQSLGTPILFDRKSQSFSVTRQVNEGGKQSTVTEPLGRSSYQAAGYGSSSSYSNNNSRSYTPSPSNNNSNSGASRSYTPAPSYNTGASSYRPSSPPPSAPAPSFSAPSSAPSPASSSSSSPHK